MDSQQAQALRFWSPTCALRAKDSTFPLRCGYSPFWAPHKRTIQRDPTHMLRSGGVVILHASSAKGMFFLITQENVILLETGPQTAPVGSHHLGRPLLEDNECGLTCLLLPLQMDTHVCICVCVYFLTTWTA